MKDIIRQRSIDRRKQLKSSQVNEFSKDICLNIINHHCFRNSEVIAVYYPFANEVSLLPLLDRKKHFVLPVVLSHHRMQFRRYNNSVDQLQANQYGIPEPINGKIIQHKDIDLCLLPLTSFDRTGQRLGMGAGYYDRYFELNQFQKKPTILAGVAYEFQESDTIPSESWDIPLDIIFTNHETIEI